MYYSEIKDCDIANGQGVRVSLFVSGCTLHCAGCFNSETWDFSYGEEFTDEVADRIIDMLSRAYIQGLSVLGGEPFEPANQQVLAGFLKKVKTRYPEKPVWVYTGYLYDTDIVSENGRVHTPYTDDMLASIDVLVDGQFVEAQHDVSLVFCGSSNQRLIDMCATRKNGAIELLTLPDKHI